MPTRAEIGLTTSDLQLLNADTGGRWELHTPPGRFGQPAELGEAFEWVEAGAAQAAELAEWLDGTRATFRNEAHEGYIALQMVHAVYESARRHEKVLLPMQTRANPLDVMVESGHLAPERPGAFDIRAFLLRGERMTSDT